MPPPPRQDFPPFPFVPYPIQTEFMSFLYSALSSGPRALALLESPTGTGKTLSIICSALQWLLDHRDAASLGHPERANGSAPAAVGGEDDEPDWMRDFTLQPLPPKKDIRKKSETHPSRRHGTKKVGGSEKSERIRENDEEEEFLLDEYESDDGEGTGRQAGKRAHCGGASSSSSSESEDDEDEEEATPKVYFTSRTHSQLSQFVGELKRTNFSGKLRTVCLGSRKSLCINMDVQKLGSANRINERCLELLKNKKSSKIKVEGDNKKGRQTKASCRCPMLGNRSLQKQFRSEVSDHGPLDIEDLAQLGRKIGTCPYYGARDMVRSADLVVLPYQSLLLKSARELLGLNLKNSVVIIDEAHNLADSLTSMYNSKVESSQLRAVLSHLEAYLDRFQNVLGAGNRRYIQTLTVLTRSFLRCLISNEDCSSAVTSMTINKFLFSLDIDNINIVKLCLYLKESNIVHKVSGYANKLFITENGVGNLNHGQQHGEGSSITSFQALTDLLRSLLYCNDDGRIIVARHKPGGQPEDAYIKFVMLCAEKTFSEVTDDAHAVILAGGTLQPIEEKRLRLFPGLLPSDIKFFSCNHIVPPESILPIAVTCGPSGKKFDFSHSSRSSLNMIEELGRFLCNIVTIVPEGIVMFLSSYEYEKQVYDAWMASGTISKISKKKHVFREPRSSVDVEVILNKYKEAIQSCSKGSGDTSVNGALLLAGVGGEISEGINFSDGMGRCVLMVGLPYPSPDDIELMETIKHIGNYSTSSVIGDDKPFNGNDECKLEPGFDVLRKSGKSGREYYENLCMKAVNQSIGRAIRHVNDYAAMLLVDSRYAHTSSSRGFSCPVEKLPQWIKTRLTCGQNYGEVHRLLLQFFKINKQIH
ncbi:ATP-dependent DNA helicase DDX11-like isoform X1 [Triticum urartu]|uniref:Helicase ATP-binding domain-containing protein n=1 Tax=Triticum urartu TaxID=4572 RepID=A0A8R7NZL4_TRIUA|nr:ATP-dependent DNA helicase DDX11-like isoform X1 [Triticum urartu]